MRGLTPCWSAARLRGRLVQGSRVRVRGAGDMSDWAEFEVSGILATGDAEDHAVLAPLAAVQKMTGLDGKIQSIEVSALTVPDNTLSRKAQRGREALTTAEYDIWYCMGHPSKDPPKRPCEQESSS